MGFLENPACWAHFGSLAAPETGEFEAYREDFRRFVSDANFAGCRAIEATGLSLYIELEPP